MGDDPSNDAIRDVARALKDLERAVALLDRIVRAKRDAAVMSERGVGAATGMRVVENRVEMNSDR